MRKELTSLFTATLLYAGTVFANEAEPIEYSILDNSDFETGGKLEVDGEGKSSRTSFGGWDIRYGWGSKGNADKIQELVSVEKGDAVSGNQSIRIKNPGGAYLALYQSVKCKVGDSFKLSWSMKASDVDNMPFVRIRHYRFGGPEYALQDFRPETKDWKTYSINFDALTDGTGQLDFWIMSGKDEDAWLQIDNIMLRKGFWSSDKEANAVAVGDTINMKVNVNGKDGQTDDITVDYKILTPLGKLHKEGGFSGALPLEETLSLIFDKPGSYTLESVTKTPTGNLTDTVPISVITSKGGIEGIRDFRQNRK